jgi:hypothetical protein
MIRSFRISADIIGGAEPCFAEIIMIAALIAAQPFGELGLVNAVHLGERLPSDLPGEQRFDGFQLTARRPSAYAERNVTMASQWSCRRRL